MSSSATPATNNASVSQKLENLWPWSRKTGSEQKLKSEELLCFLCKELPIEAVQLDPCKHTFCFTCIEEWTTGTVDKPPSRECPKCRTAFVKRMPNKQANRLVDHLELKMKDSDLSRRQAVKKRHQDWLEMLDINNGQHIVFDYFLMLRFYKKNPDKKIVPLRTINKRTLVIFRNLPINPKKIKSSTLMLDEARMICVGRYYQLLHEGHGKKFTIEENELHHHMTNGAPDSCMLAVKRRLSCYFNNEWHDYPGVHLRKFVFEHIPYDDNIQFIGFDEAKVRITLRKAEQQIVFDSEGREKKKLFVCF